MPTTNPEVISKALSVADDYFQDPNVHAVMWGRKRVNGILTGEEGVVVFVDKKLPASVVNSNDNDHIPIAKTFKIRTVENFKSVYHNVPVDVQEKPRAKIELLRIKAAAQPHYAKVFAANQNARSCWSPLVPAGAQIAPKDEDWVGTLGCPWVHQDGTIGFLTNRHVVGTKSVAGRPICQPTAQDGVVGTLHSRADMTRSGNNYVDVAFVNATNRDNRFLVNDRIIGLGRIGSTASVALGDRVHKHGRTTDLTEGVVEGLDARTRVEYEEGRLQFVNQIYVETPGSQFSQPGDSGAGVWIKTRSSVRPDSYDLVGLLFSGNEVGTFVNSVSEITKVIPGSPLTL